MKSSGNYFPEVTLLITHFNRSASLERLLNEFKKLNCHFGAIIVSDDRSSDFHLNKIKALQKTFNFGLVTSPQNKGLGNNINKGQDSIKTEYTLYIQEDFVPRAGFPAHFRDALCIMKERADIDIVRFYAYFLYPELEPYKNGFSEMIFCPGIFYWNYKKFYCYSDHPHLRRSSFLKKFGRYYENVPSDITETQMSFTFLKKGGKAMFYNDFTSLFDQVNSAEEPSTVKRSKWRNSKVLPVQLLRAIYLQYKYLRYHFKLLYFKTP